MLCPCKYVSIIIKVRLSCSSKCLTNMIKNGDHLFLIIIWRHEMTWKQSIFEPCGVDCCFQVNTKCGKMWNVKFKRFDNLKAGIMRLSSIYILHQTLFPLIFFHSGKYFALPVSKINCLINYLINKLQDQYRRSNQM